VTDTLFPEIVFPKAQPAEKPEKPEKLSADRRRTKRQKDMLANGIHPVTRLKLTETAGATCGNCALRMQFGHRSKTYAKCTLGAPEGQPHKGPHVTNSAATDCRAWWGGCSEWQPKNANPHDLSTPVENPAGAGESA
jgi:hypothetical protein